MKFRTILAISLLAVSAGCKEESVNPPLLSSLSIHFQEGFLADSVSVSLDGTLVYGATITTNQDSGLAALFATNVTVGARLLSIQLPGTGARVDSVFIINERGSYVSVAYSKVNRRLYLTSLSSRPTYKHRILKQKFFFSSYRSGSAQNIFMMNLDGSNVIQLTHYTQGEYRGPRISADGRRLLYYRFDGEDGSGTLENGIYIKNIYEPDPENRLDYGVSPNFSADGQSVVYSKGGILTLRLSDLTPTRITTNTIGPNNVPINLDWNPVYSPDGSQIAFNSWRPISSSDTIVYNHWDVMIMNSDGTNQRFLVHSMFQWCGVPTFSPNGVGIAFTRHTGVSEYYISTMGLADSTWRDIVRAPNAQTTKAHYNPEGTRIYFQSGYPANALEMYWVSASGGSYQRITSNQVADTDPYVASAWVHE